MLDLDNIEAAAPMAKHQVRKAAQGSGTFENVQLINTGIKVADVQSGKVSIKQLQEATLGQNSQARIAPHPNWEQTPSVLNETMSGFTSGSQSSPVKVSSSGGMINCKESTSDNLYGWEVYSLGGGMGALIGSGEFRVIDIDYGTDMSIGFWVAALQNGAAVMCNYIEGTEGDSFLVNSQPMSIPYDGNFYFATLNKSAYTDKSGNVVHANVSLMIMNTDGTNDTNIAFGGLFVSGKRYSGSTVDPTPTPGVEVGAPTDVNYTLADDHQSYSVDFRKGTNATHTEIYSYCDIDAQRKISSLDLLNIDFAGVNAGTNDPSQPNTGSASPDVVLDAIPGGLVHWPVLINGALGFWFDLTNVANNTTCNWAGFETSDYDLTATGGVATLFLNHYATDGAAMQIMVAGLNKSTNKYEVIDEAYLDGNSLQWDGWQETTVTTDQISASKYDLRHIYFAVATTMDEEYVTALIEGGQATDWPVIIYYKNIEITLNNIPAGSKFQYLDAERQTTGTNFPKVPCPNFDREGYTYSFAIRSMNVGNTISYSDWYKHPEHEGNIIVKDNTGVNSIEANEKADAPVEYYNLQGVRVDNPAKGQLLIRRQGNNVDKIIL